MNESVLVTIVIPGLVAILFGVVGFQIRNLYTRVGGIEKRQRELEVELATNSEQNRSIMIRLDQIGTWCTSIEGKLDKLIETILRDRGTKK